MFARVVPLCVVFLLCAAFTPAQDVKKELEALQDDWTMVAREQNGKKYDELFKVTLKGNEWQLTAQGKVTTTTFKIDPSKNPKTIDLMTPGGTVSEGIYKLEGDTLTVCRTLNQKKVARPKEFKSDGGNLLIVLKREKK